MNLEKLFSEVNHLLAEQKNLARLKGENFNVFSVLKVETKENNTHSAFIGELLNPEGSHLFGSEFLELFLKAIEYKGDINPKKSQVYLEYQIGIGRIDIVIADDKKNFICIENKIYASDQGEQIKKYVHYQTGNNKVYYLTLDGSLPSSDSRGDLEVGKDFHCLSYGNQIVTWLELCMQHALDQPILRETIKQYLILIRRLTSTMDDESDLKLKELILDNIDAAEHVHMNFEAALNLVRKDFYESSVNSILERLTANKEWELQIRDNDNWEIYIEFGNNDFNELRFTVGGFNGKEPLFLAIDRRGIESDELLSEFKPSGLKTSYPDLWAGWKWIEKFSSYEIWLKGEVLKNIRSSNSFKKDLVSHVTQQVTSFIDEYYQNASGFNESIV